MLAYSVVLKLIVGGGGECVLHFLFANDTILFCDVDVEQIFHVWLLLLCFQSVTGLKVNV